MNAEEFIDQATSSEAWLKKSKQLRENAEILWGQFAEEIEEFAEVPEEENERRIEIVKQANSHLSISKMLYGLALETAFKAYIIKEFPDDIELNMVADGNGEIYKVNVKQMGVSLNKGHDLIALATKAGVFEREGNPIFDNEQNFKLFHHILQHLNEMVLWKARYPVPIRSDDDNYETPDDLSYMEVGVMYVKLIDPVLDHYYENI